MKLIYQMSGLIIIVSFIVGCSQLLINIESPSPDPSSVPNYDVSRTETPILTSIPTPTARIVALPTLPVEDARERLLGLLATNGDCQLPCFWGITPGESNNQESQSVLLPLSGISETIYFNQPKVNGISLGAITPFYYEDNFRLNVRVAYTYSDDGIVNRINFRVLEEEITTDSKGNWVTKQPVFDSTSFLQRTEYYSLSHILTQQGVPPLVMIEASRLTAPVVAGGFDIALFYPERGVWANYTMVMNNQGSTKIGCPVNTHMTFSLYPPGNPDSFFSLLDQTDWGITKAGYKPLEKATSMSAQQFYETFRTPTDQCIETPANLWPIPD